MRFPAEITLFKLKLSAMCVFLFNSGPLEYPLCKNTVNLHKTNTKGDGIVHLHTNASKQEQKQTSYYVCVSIYVCACTYTVYTSFVLLFSDFTSQKNDSSCRF